MIAAPAVRVVVVNWNGGQLTHDCLQSLLATDWPADSLELLVVDNASTDGSAEKLARDFPRVTIIRNTENVGFAEACNQGARSPGAYDFLALVNNDATVDPGWLAPLVEVLQADPQLGAACPKILFAPSFVDVEVHVRRRPDTARGVELRQVSVDGRDVSSKVQYRYGFDWGRDRFSIGRIERHAGSDAAIRVPLPPDVTAPESVEVVLEGEAAIVELRCGGSRVIHRVDGKVATVPAGAEPYRVINNLGVEIDRLGRGTDRAFRERDDGSQDQPAEVAGWSGGGVLLRRPYLDDCGLFDPQFFIYYEDLDLSWRGRRRGWRYRTVPASVLNHVHTATNVEGSARFWFHNDRNRLLMLARNAAVTTVLEAVWEFLVTTGSYARQDVVSPLLARQRPGPAMLALRLRTLLSFLALAPGVIWTRLRGTQKIGTRPPRQVSSWLRPGGR